MKEIKSTDSHTCGPWYRDPVQDSDYMIICRSGTRRVVAIITEDAVDESEEELSNLRLVTAAPELLAACLNAYESAKSALEGEWDRSDEGFAAQKQRLEKVIKKALGFVPQYAGEVRPTKEPL